MSVIYLVPSMHEKSNPFLYCNYARMNPEDERCMKCKNDCIHKGKHTVLNKS